MSIGDKMNEIEEKAKHAKAESEKDLKNAWTDTKAAAEKTKNEADAHVDQM